MERLITLLTVLFIAAGCGAPTKDAGEVTQIFDDSGGSLQDKVFNLCSSLESREKNPSLKTMNMQASGCREAGRMALNYRTMEGFLFAGIDSQVVPDGNNSDDKVIRIETRSQVWLNKSLLGLVSAMSAAMEAKKASGELGPGRLELPSGGSGGGGGLENLARPEINIIEAIDIDMEKMEINGLINFKLTGAVEADHDIRIEGALIDNAFAVTIETTKDQVFEKSLLKSLKAMVIVMPYASDVYLDVFLNLEVHSIGFDDAFKDALIEMLSSGIKPMADSLLAL